MLFLTHTTPLPLVSGERIRSFNLIRQLASRGWRVSLFSLSGDPVGEAARRGLEEACERVVIARHAPLPLLRALRLGRDVAGGRAFHRSYFWTHNAQRELSALLARGRFDALVVCQLYMAPYVPEARFAETVFDSVNVESRRLATIAASGLSLRGLVARLQMRPVRTFETDVAARSAQVLAVSPEEFEYFEAFAPGRVSLVPNGVDTEWFTQRTSPAPSSELLFMGSLDYSANVDAVLYLVREILPRLRDRAFEVTVVGTKPPAILHETARRAPVPVRITGFVESVEPYIRRARALVVPLRHGAGTRLKILQALASGLPVITTSMGCEGLSLEHDRDVLVADEPAEFAKAIERLLDDDALCRRLSSNGRRTVEQHYDWALIGATMDNVLARLVDRERVVTEP